MTRLRSLQARLMLVLLLIVPATWLAASAAAVWLAQREVDELFDTQMAQFARQLLAIDVHGMRPDDPPKLKHLLAGADKGRMDNDDMGLAIWDAQGRQVLCDGRGRRFDYEPTRRGFHDFIGHDHHHDWRLLYLPAPDGSRMVAVGQKLGLRQEMVWSVVKAQLLPWMIGLPLMLLAILLALRRELAPFRRLAGAIAARAPDDNSPVPDEVPQEVRPLVRALNALFVRIGTMLEHERRFTADAAHELRTPLAALRVQAEVLALTPDEGGRRHALSQLQLGIERAGRLVEQLLALSRLDPLQSPRQREAVVWGRLAEGLMAELAATADGVEWRLDWRCPPEQALPLSGDPTLVGLMLRNLLENACRYGPADGVVELRLEEDAVSVLDRGPGIAPEWLERVRERFFRPPGQEQPGSGLGLSIVERIAELHGLRLALKNRLDGGLEARLERA
ncbi:ATP-binding protein [Chromobacterium piscinae]|uniref:histidine kinase n=2 Tax=Chromobacterium piscinae TaxID=686831 RepID=A0ABV0H1D6_9NEIS|nr:ATP-binding protein [Chromobacterium piscinae]MCD4503138.1 ATP-binding protein [Chromobacterium piscinae]